MTIFLCIKKKTKYLRTYNKTKNMYVPLCNLVKLDFFPEWLSYIMVTTSNSFNFILFHAFKKLILSLKICIFSMCTEKEKMKRVEYLETHVNFYSACIRVINCYNLNM